MANGFKWEGDLSEQRIDQVGPFIKRAMVAAAGRTAAEATTWMRTNARWTDRTSNARNGLMGKSVVSTNKVAVVLYHSVPYGIWLEVRWDGRYAIVEPALREFAPRMMRLVAKLAMSNGGR